MPHNMSIEVIEINEKIGDEGAFKIYVLAIFFRMAMMQ